MKKWLPIALLLVASAAPAAVAPAFQGETLDGRRLNLGESLRPGRAVLVSFWATWCVPCLDEVRQVAEHLKAEPTLPLDVITVNTDTAETASDIKPTVRMQKLPFPVVLDPTNEILGRYHPTKTLPFSVLVGPNGAIEATFDGYHESMYGQIKAKLERLAKR